MAIIADGRYYQVRPKKSPANEQRILWSRMSSRQSRILRSTDRQTTYALRMQLKLGFEDEDISGNDNYRARHLSTAISRIIQKIRQMDHMELDDLGMGEV